MLKSLKKKRERERERERDWKELGESRTGDVQIILGRILFKMQGQKWKWNSALASRVGHLITLTLVNTAD
jgi:hypothetical protein